MRGLQCMIQKVINKLVKQFIASPFNSKTEAQKTYFSSLNLLAKFFHCSAHPKSTPCLLREKKNMKLGG